MSEPAEAGPPGLPDDRSRGDRAELDELMPLVHAELHRLAASYLSRERSARTLQPTALINEVYLKLAGQDGATWNSRTHFIAVAAQLMRFILVDHCRSKRYAKRGGGAIRVTFDENLNVFDDSGAELIDLDEKLKKLELQDPRKSRIAELRFFGGLSVEETAEAMSISVATVMRDWRVTKAWLQRELS
jgi:RNA polymerase sigma-70 factor, ECF subfamily